MHRSAATEGSRPPGFYLVASLCLLVPAMAVLATEDAGPSVAGDLLTWTTEQTHLKARVTVTGPGDLLHERFLEPGESLTIDLASRARAPLPDGQYHWRIELTSPLFADQQEALSQARRNGDPSEIDRILRSAEFHAITRAGSLRRSDGQWIESETFAPTKEGQGKMDLIVDGRLGIGGQAPAREIHMVDGTTPTIRFEQDTTGGSAPQVWDVEANELGLWFRDATHANVPFSIGSNGQGVQLAERLSILSNGGASWSFIGQDNALRISRDGTGQSELVIDDSGDLTLAGGFNVDVLATTAVEIGNYRLADQGDALEIGGGSGNLRLRDQEPELSIESTDSTLAPRALLSLQNQGAPILEMLDTSTNSSWNLAGASQFFSLSKNTTGQTELVLNENGDLSIAGNLGIYDSVNMGSIRFKDHEGELKISGDHIDNELILGDQVGLLVQNTNDTAAQRINLKVVSKGIPTIQLQDSATTHNWNLSLANIASDPGFQISRGGTGVGELFLDPEGNLVLAGDLFACRHNCDSQLQFPDYVFRDGYKLMPLDQLEKFIAENKHLPQIPTAAEVDQRGIGISKFQWLLLEKVEELTLYTLEQNRVIHQQAEVIEGLESRLTFIEDNAAFAKTNP